MQEAAQTLTAIFLVPPMLLQFVFLALQDQMRDFVAGLDGEQIFLMIVLVFAVIDVAVNAAAMARFQRSRLALD